MIATNAFDIKTLLMTPFIKWAINHPEIMKSELFLKVMVFFPEKISHYYDSKVIEKNTDYPSAISEGLKQIEENPKTILDLCTGTGLTAFMAAEMFPGASVLGLDQSKSMIEIARKKVPPAESNRIRFELGNVADLNEQLGKFDLVLTTNGPIYLSEAVKVMETGGTIMVAYFFGGKAFVNAKNELENLLDKNNLSLTGLGSAGRGAYIIAKKKQKDTFRPSEDSVFCNDDLDNVGQSEKDLIQLQKELADLKARWPAHSVKPSMIIELEELEEKIRQINNMK